MQVSDIELCRARVFQKSAPVEDVEQAVRRACAGLGGQVRPGMSVAIAAGSRGIANLARIVKTLVEVVKAAGANPFIVPAMGSHGGGTARGQAEVLAGYGITAPAMGAPVFSSMETVEIARMDEPPHLPVYMDQAAWESDGIIVVNRVKPHTDFHGPHESGIVKMLVIGLGKQAQAEAVHRYGANGLRDLIPPIAQAALRSGKILGGLAILEDGCDQTSDIAYAPAEEFFALDADFLARARDMMARLPFDHAHVLIVDEMGKDISGTGMDTNVIGRMVIRGVADGKPDIARIVALRLTPASHGNALGVGMADVVPRALADAIDWEATYNNILTSGFYERGFLPVVRETDADAVQAALFSCGAHDPAQARVARIRNTLALDEMYLSRALMEEAVAAGRALPLGEFSALACDYSMPCSPARGCDT